MGQPTGRSWTGDEENLRAWTQGIHRAILEDRGISLAEVGRAMGTTRERARQLLGDPWPAGAKAPSPTVQSGYSEDIALRIEDAIDQISAERGLVPAQALSWPEGAPAPEWVSEEATEELERRSDLSTRYLMTPGAPRASSTRRRFG